MPFDPPVEIVEIGPADDPFLSEDGRTIWFVAPRGNAYALFVANRAQRGAPFDTPIPLSELDDFDYREAGPTLSRDLRTILFSSDRPGGAGGADLYRAERATSTGPFSPPVRLDLPNTAGHDCCASLLDDGSLIYATAEPPGPQRIVTSAWDGVAYGPPEPVTALAVGSSEHDPYAPYDGSVVVFGSVPIASANGVDMFIVDRSCQ